MQAHKIHKTGLYEHKVHSHHVEQKNLQLAIMSERILWSLHMLTNFYAATHWCFQYRIWVSGEQKNSCNDEKIQSHFFIPLFLFLFFIWNICEILFHKIISIKALKLFSDLLLHYCVFLSARERKQRKMRKFIPSFP